MPLPDKDDRHVLATAIAGHADCIVTFNLKDFPAEALARHDIEALHPDDFIMNQLQLHQLTALTAVKKMRSRWYEQTDRSHLIVGVEPCLAPVGLPPRSKTTRPSIQDGGVRNLMRMFVDGIESA